MNLSMLAKRELLLATQSSQSESDRTVCVLPSDLLPNLTEQKSAGCHDESKKASQIVWSRNETAICDYFSELTCNLRVLGSQFGLEPYELDEIEDQRVRLCERKQNLLEKCVSKEKLTSWEHLAATLEKPAVNLRRMAREIRDKCIDLKQDSLVSPSISSPWSLDHSLLSSVEVSDHDQKFTIPEAVNLIVVVDVGNLKELGRKLGVDEAKLNCLSEYVGIGCHQRLIEAWFEQAEHEPTRNVLLEALPRRGSSVSMSSLPPTPTFFEPTNDIEAQIDDFEIRFSILQAETEEELTNEKKTVETISARLRGIPPRLLSKDTNMEYIKKLSSYNAEKPKSLKELFLQLNECCWNYFEYEVLKFVIESNRCSPVLVSRMDEYANDIKTFKDTTTIAKFAEHGRRFYKVKEIPAHHKVVKIKQHIDPAKTTLSNLDHIREDVWSNMKLSECIRCQTWDVRTGCVEIEWIVPEEYDYDLISIFCAEAGKELMERHHIEKIYINDVLISNSLLLLTAAYYEIWEKVNSLLTGDIDLNVAKHVTGETALFFVAAKGKEDLVRIMLDQGADLNAKNHDGKTPLMLASELGHELTILLLLDRGVTIDLKEAVRGKTSLYFAAENGHDVATSILVAYGADPNQKDMGSETPYDIAKMKGYDKVCEELLPPELRKQPEVRSDSARHKVAETLRGITKGLRAVLFRTDLIEAVKNDDLKTIKSMLQKERETALPIDAREADEHGWTSLMWASDRGNIHIVDLLLNKGANPNITSKSMEWSSLMIASRKGHLKVVKKLLEHGAVLDHQNVNGLSSLSISIYEKRTAVALFLIHKGASIHLAEKTGWNPLSRASTEGNLKLLKIIADRGGHLNDVILEYNWTSVMLAAKYGHGEVVKELVERGADLTITTREGDTVLHIATLKRQSGVIKQLATAKQPEDAETKFSLDITNRDGLTALMVATNKGYVEEMDALLEGGADVNATHKGTGWTAIFFAAKNGSVELVQNLLHHNAKTELDDGTRLIDVASHLKQMSIIDILGTDVDSKPASQLREPQDVDRTVRTFEAAFRAMEERVLMWKKVA